MCFRGINDPDFIKKSRKQKVDQWVDNVGDRAPDERQRPWNGRHVEARVGPRAVGRAADRDDGDS